MFMLRSSASPTVASSPNRLSLSSRAHLTMFVHVVYFCLRPDLTPAGQGVNAIRDIPSAGEVVARLWKECLDAT